MSMGLAREEMGVGVYTAWDENGNKLINQS